MEENHNENTYIIQTIDLSTTNSSDVTSNECVLNEESDPIFISTDDINDTAQYITCYENGEIVLNKIESNNKDESLAIAKKQKKSSIKLKNVKKQEFQLHKVQKLPLHMRKKLCYEKPHNINTQPLTIHSKNIAPILLKYPRKQIIDTRIMISPREFKRQLMYTADTITTTKLAPCTRQQLVHVLNGITTLFAHPAHKMPNANLMQMYVARCTCKKVPNMMTTTDDMNLLPLIENINSSVKQIHGKRKTSATPTKVQIIENVTNEITDTNINLSTIKKIYQIRKCINTDPLADDDGQEITFSINENIDHKYSKEIQNEQELGETNIIEEIAECDDDSMYTITLDIDNIKEEHINDNQIVILRVDNDGELTENNINVLLDAANIKTEITNETNNKNEVVALTRNVDTEDFNNKLSNIFVVRKSEENNDSEQILGVQGISDLTTS